MLWIIPQDNGWLFRSGHLPTPGPVSQKSETWLEIQTQGVTGAEEWAHPGLRHKSLQLPWLLRGVHLLLLSCSNYFLRFALQRLLPSTFISNPFSLQIQGTLFSIPFLKSLPVGSQDAPFSSHLTGGTSLVSSAVPLHCRCALASSLSLRGSVHPDLPRWSVCSHGFSYLLRPHSSCIQTRFP